MESRSEIFIPDQIAYHRAVLIGIKDTNLFERLALSPGGLPKNTRRVFEVYFQRSLKSTRISFC